MPGPNTTFFRDTDTGVGITRRSFLRGSVLTSVGVSVPSIPVSAVSIRGLQARQVAEECHLNANTALKEVKGKVAFITGGSSGIGLGIARAFVAAGMKVVITYRTQSHIDEAMKTFEKQAEQVHPVNVDVRDRQAMERAAGEAVDHFGKVHVLVNNAGILLPGTLNDTTYADWDDVVNVNLTGAFNGVHVFLPHIKSHGEGGHIVTTSSVVGLFSGPGAGAYCATKFAVVGMMEQLRTELTGSNIGVSVYCPGVIEIGSVV